MYFIEKTAQYLHGIWWHGDKVDDGITALRRISDADYDDHHTYTLLKFNTIQDPENCDPKHQLIASVKKGKPIKIHRKDS